MYSFPIGRQTLLSYMTFQSRRTNALSILKKTRIWRCNYEPPYLRFLWRMGVELPPPHFVPFFQTASIAAAWFSLLWGAFMWFFVWGRQGMLGSSAIAISCATGTFFGVVMASYYAYGRRKYHLPRWVSLGEQD